MARLVKLLMTRRRSLGALFCSCSVAICLLIANDQLLRSAARDNPASRVNWLFLSAPQHFDIVILGSSMAKEGVDPVLLSELTGKAAIQLAWGGRGVAEQALYWELFLERHQCQTLLLELHPRGLEQGVLRHPLDEFRYVARLENSIVARHVIRQFGWLKPTVWRFVPMWAMAEFSTQIGWHDLLAIRRGESFEPNAPADNQHTGNLEDLLLQRSDRGRLPGATEIDLLAVEQFTEIIALCREHQIEVIAFLPPIFEADSALYDSVDSSYRKLLQGPAPIYRPVSEYLSDGTCFQDAFHLNEKGSRKFTQGLAEFLELVEK